MDVEDDYSSFFRKEVMEESRAPSIEDLLKLCKELNQRGAKYLIVGGMAMIEHGFARATEDIDLLVSVDIENFKKIQDSLLTLPDQAVKELTFADLEEYVVVRVADEIVIDLMGKACGVTYADASSDIEWLEIDGVQIPFASAPLMLKMKQGVREKDVMDRKFLERILEQRRK